MSTPSKENISVEETIRAIRVIAKTKEIEEKADKALKQSFQYARPKIEAQRRSTQQSRNSAGNGDSLARNDEGEPTEAPITVGPGNSVSQGANDGVQNAVNGMNQGTTGGLNPYGNNSNLGGTSTSGGNTGNPMTGGSSVQNGLGGGGGHLSQEEFQNRVDQLQARIDAIQAKGDAKGQDQADINKEIQQEINRFNGDTSSSPDTPKGVYRVGNLFTDGSMGLWPSEGSGDGITSAPGSPKISALVGEIGGKLGVLLLREADENDFRPTNYDVANDEYTSKFGDWVTNGLSGIEKTWQPGMFWRVQGGYTGPDIVGQTFDEVIAERVARDPGQPAQAYGIDGGGIIVNIGGTPGDVAIQITSAGQSIGNPASGGTQYALNHVALNRIEQVSCLDNGNPGVCDLTPPRANRWPLTGTIAFGWKNGKLQFNIMDSEVPPGLRKDVSQIIMTDGGIQYTIGPTLQGGWYVSMDATMPSPDIPAPAILIRADGGIKDVVPKAYLGFYTAQSKGFVAP